MTRVRSIDSSVASHLAKMTRAPTGVNGIVALSSVYSGSLSYDSQDSCSESSRRPTNREPRNKALSFPLYIYFASRAETQAMKTGTTQTTRQMKRSATTETTRWTIRRTTRGTKRMDMTQMTKDLRQDRDETEEEDAQRNPPDTVLSSSIHVLSIFCPMSTSQVMRRYHLRRLPSRPRPFGSHRSWSACNASVFLPNRA